MPRGITEIQLYADLGESTAQLSNDELPVKALFARGHFPTLLRFIIEAKKGTISYNSQRVMRQLGDDQSAT